MFALMVEHFTESYSAKPIINTIFFIGVKPLQNHSERCHTFQQTVVNSRQLFTTVCLLFIVISIRCFFLGYGSLSGSLFSFPVFSLIVVLLFLSCGSGCITVLLFFLFDILLGWGRSSTSEADMLVSHLIHFL